MIQRIDYWLNGVTMYRLVAYYLAWLVAVAAVLSGLGVMLLDPYALLFSAGFFMALCWLSNTIFAAAFRVPVNVESAYISALILALIIAPLSGYGDLVAMGWVAVLAMASKYMLALWGKHIFNPIAVAVVITTFAINQTASWWVGTGPMLPFVLIGGVLLVRKLRRVGMVLSFLLAATFTTLGVSLFEGSHLLNSVSALWVASPLLFFGFAILTEPLTMPPTFRMQLVYGGLVGILFAPQLHLGAFYFTPELAIVLGNLMSYVVSPKHKLVLEIKDKIHLGADLWDFVFEADRPLAYLPGQYMEWTLGHVDPDIRGNRRYFTLASSPTEKMLRLGVKFPQDLSSFKQAMLDMGRGATIVAAQLAGDFTLPHDLSQKCVLIAGGIGITPFRSMIKYALDKDERRPLTLFYAARTSAELVYTDIFAQAQQQLGLKTIYTLTDPTQVPIDWRERVGYLDANVIAAEVPDYAHSLFYLSGPNTMVLAFEATLIAMGVQRSHIRKDFFPGFA